MPLRFKWAAALLVVAPRFVGRASIDGRFPPLSSSRKPARACRIRWDWNWAIRRAFASAFCRCRRFTWSTSRSGARTKRSILTAPEASVRLAAAAFAGRQFRIRRAPDCGGRPFLSISIRIPSRPAARFPRGSARRTRRQAIGAARRARRSGAAWCASSARPTISTRSSKTSRARFDWPRLDSPLRVDLARDLARRAARDRGEPWRACRPVGGRAFGWPFVDRLQQCSDQARGRHSRRRRTDSKVRCRRTSSRPRRSNAFSACRTPRALERPHFARRQNGRECANADAERHAIEFSGTEFRGRAGVHQAFRTSGDFGHIGHRRTQSGADIGERALRCSTPKATGASRRSISPR